VAVPVNATASVRLPRARAESVLESGERLIASTGISRVRENGRDVVVEIGSGSYLFSYSLLPNLPIEQPSPLTPSKLRLLLLFLLLLTVTLMRGRRRNTLR